MPTDREKLDYLNEIVRTRGYAHGSHRLLANHDLDVLKAVNGITLANYIPARHLSEADKELVLVAAFTAIRSQPAIIRAHIQKAAKAGAGLRQSLAAIELTLLEAGRSALDAGLDAWNEVASAAASSPAPANGAAGQNSKPSMKEDSMTGTILERHDPEVGLAINRLQRGYRPGFARPGRPHARDRQDRDPGMRAGGGRACGGADAPRAGRGRERARPAGGDRGDHHAGGPAGVRCRPCGLGAGDGRKALGARNRRATQPRTSATRVAAPAHAERWRIAR